MVRKKKSKISGGNILGTTIDLTDISINEPEIIDLSDDDDSRIAAEGEKPVTPSPVKERSLGGNSDSEIEEIVVVGVVLKPSPTSNIEEKQTLPVTDTNTFKAESKNDPLPSTRSPLNFYNIKNVVDQMASTSISSKSKFRGKQQPPLNSLLHHNPRGFKKNPPRKAGRGRGQSHLQQQNARKTQYRQRSSYADKFFPFSNSEKNIQRNRVLEPMFEYKNFREINQSKRPVVCPKNIAKDLNFNPPDVLPVWTSYGLNSYVSPDGKKEDDRSPGKLRPIYIDGSNVAMAHGKKTFSSSGIKLCIEYFKTRGHREIKAFVPQFRLKSKESNDPAILEELEKDGFVVFTPSREVGRKRITSYDDRFIVQCAAVAGAVIVSNDNFKDLYNEEISWRETIENRILQFTWIDENWIMFANDPLGRNGPHLDDFLKF